MLILDDILSYIIVILLKLALRRDCTRIKALGMIVLNYRPSNLVILSLSCFSLI